MGDSGAGARVRGVWGGGAVGDSVGGYGACTARPGVKNLRPLRQSLQIKVAVDNPQQIKVAVWSAKECSSVVNLTL